MVERLTMWTVYDHPADFPDHYVAREWVVVSGQEPRPTSSTIQSSDLDKLREILLVDFHLTKLDRNDEDDPTIVESWI